MERPFRASKVTKLLYLVANPHLLNQGGREVVKAMKEAGLVSPKTYWRDVGPDKLKLEANQMIEAQRNEA